MADFSLSLQVKTGLIGVTLPEFLIILSILGMEKVKIKIVHSAGLKLTLKEGTNVFLTLKVRIRQFICQEVGLPGIAFGQEIPDRQF